MRARTASMKTSAGPGRSGASRSRQRSQRGEPKGKEVTEGDHGFPSVRVAPRPERRRAALLPSAAEDVLGDALEVAFFALRARDLRRVVDESHRVQLTHHRAVIVKILVDLDEQ